MLRYSNLILTAIVISGCTVVTDDKKDDSAQVVEVGKMEVNKDAAAQGTMVEWNNGATTYPLHCPLVFERRMSDGRDCRCTRPLCTRQQHWSYHATQ